MANLLSLTAIILFVYLLPGIMVWALLVRVGLFSRPSNIDIADSITLSFSANIILSYILFVFNIGSVIWFQLYIFVLTVLLASLWVLRGADVADLKLRISALALLTAGVLAWRVLPDLGLPIMAWDAIQVWQAMAEALSEGEALRNTATYPHGLGALGAVAMAVGGGLEDHLALRTVTVMMPFVALAAVLSYWRDHERIAAGVFAAVFLVGFAIGLDGISFKYSTSFTSDVFLFSMTVTVILAAFKFSEIYQDANRQVSRLMLSPAYIVLAAAIFVVANAKQTGLSFIVLPGLIALVFARRDTSVFGRFRNGIILSVVPALLGVSWYVFAAIRDVGAADGANLQFLLVGVHQGRDLLERAELAAANMAALLPVWLWIVSLPAAIMGAFSRRGLVTVIASLPTTLFYFTVSGYAARNSTGVIAAIFLLALMGYASLFRAAVRLVEAAIADSPVAMRLRYLLDSGLRLDIRALGAVSAVTIGVSAVTGGAKLSSYLEAQHVRGGFEIGFRGINALLIREAPTSGEVRTTLITNYHVAGQIPQLSKYTIQPVATDKNSLHRALEVLDETALVFILWPDRAPATLQDYLICLIRSEFSQDVGTRWDGFGTQYVYLRTNSEVAETCFI